MLPTKQEDLELFVGIYNNVASYPTLDDVANRLGISVKTVRNRVAELRARDGWKSKLVHRGATVIPLSEDPNKSHEAWSRGQCIEELRRIAEANPEKVITRNFFRNEGRIAESVWNVHFGTFEEFKRQAGIKLSRQQHALERAIAKHASVDHYRAITIERLDWGGRYDKPSGRRFQTMLVASDLHDTEIDPFFLRVFIDTARRLQPDVIVLGGDVFDLPEFGKYTVDPREWDPVKRISFVHEHILKPLREACPDAQIDIIEGNHEARLLRHLADATPALRAVLSDLHGFTIGRLLGLEPFEVNYVAKGDLCAWTERDFAKELANNYKVYWDSALIHHFPYARNMGLPGANGHHHTHQVWPGFNPIYGPYEWHQLGTGHRRWASYTEGEKWHLGFDIIYVDTQKHLVIHDYNQLTDFACVGGQFYVREPHEQAASIAPRLLMAA